LFLDKSVKKSTSAFLFFAIPMLLEFNRHAMLYYAIIFHHLTHLAHLFLF